MNRVDRHFGGTALSKAVVMGANKFKTVETLLDDACAFVDFRTFSGGGTALTAAVDNEDSEILTSFE